MEEDAPIATRRTEALVKERIIGRPCSPYAPVTDDVNKSASVLSEPENSAREESRQQQSGLRGWKLRYLRLILILRLAATGKTESGYSHHQPFKWILRNVGSNRVIREITTTGAPTFSIKISDLFPTTHSLWGTYWCPSSNPGKSYCHYPGYLFCGYWGCETIVTSNKWSPEKEDEFLRVDWGPRGCIPPIFAYNEMLDWRGDCVGLDVEIRNPTNADWLLGKTWSVFRRKTLKDPGTLIQITKVRLQTRQTLGPNRVLNPHTSKPVVDNTKNNAKVAAPNNAKTLDTFKIEMPPLWRLLNLSYQLLNSTNPNITANCWLCFDIRPPFYEAVGVPSKPGLVNGPNPSQCLWNTTNIPGITMQYVSGQGSCVGKVPPGKKVLCANEIRLEKESKTKWLVPASNTKWICSKTGVTPCISLNIFDQNNEFCIQAMIVPRIIYHPEEYIYEHLSPSTFNHIQKREPITDLTIAALLTVGAAGAGTGIASLVGQNQRFHSLRVAVDEDLVRTEQSITVLEKSLRSLSEVVLQNCRGLDLLFLQRGGLCAALGEECCVYADNTGVVRDTMAKLREGLEKRRRDREAQQGWFDSWLNHSPWLTALISTLAGLIITIVLTLIFGPCILNRLMLFVKSRLEQVNILLLERQQLLYEKYLLIFSLVIPTNTPLLITTS